MTTAVFHFAWVLSAATTFSAGTHAVEDETVFGFEISQNEGEFATAKVQIERPSAGLLNVSRKQYAWISVTKDAVTTALFFGRVVGLPRDLSGDVVTLEFVSQFPNWESALSTLFGTLKVAPFWDPALISADDLLKPDTALEARRALYNFDRVTGAVTASDVITGDTTTAITDHLQDSLQFDITGNPAKSVRVRATVEWEQRISGTTDKVNRRIREEFGGPVNTLTPDSMVNAWPAPGVSVGGQSGYHVTKSSIRQINPLPSSMSASSATYAKKIDETELAYAQAVLGTTGATREATIPRAWFETQLEVHYDYRQSRSETITVTIANDVQNLAFDNDGGQIDIDLRGENVVALGYMDPRWSSYFISPRGKTSFGYCLARAQAALAASARAVEIKIERPLWSALDVSCKNAHTITDSRLPGGAATGKVKDYTLSVDGATGTAIAKLTLAVSVGNGATYTAGGVEGDYCDDDYVGSDYQTVTGEDIIVGIPAIVFTPYDTQLPLDPSIITKLMSKNIVQEITVTNGPGAQASLLAANQYPSNDDAAQVVEQNPTEMNVELRSLAPQDDLTHTITVAVVHPFAAPKGIDLAAA